MRRWITGLLLGLMTGLLAACAGEGGGGGQATQTVTAPPIQVECLVPRVGQTVVDQRTNRAGRVVGVRRVGQLVTVTVQEEDSGGGASTGGPVFDIDIDCGDRDSGNTTTPPPA